MTFTEGAALPTSLWVAYHAMYQVARVEERETVLIHQASSSVGQMMIQLAINRGARVLATASTTSKREFIRNKFGIPSNYILAIDEPLFRRKLYELTDGQGVDVVIGSLASPSYFDFSECLSHCGRIVDISLEVPRGSANAIPRKQVKSMSHTSFNVSDILQRKPDFVHRCFKKAVKCYLEENIKPPQPLRTFQAGDVEEAFRSFRDPERAGKRVVELTEGTAFDVDCVTKPLYTFPANASYIIAGGLGGLGRSFARWMASRGARYPILLSTSSKMTGSWNLHRALPEDLDFFVLLASLNGIFGSRAQANYAAGNTFKDALAHYRLARGQKAVSIDLGLMVAEGVVAESEFLLASMRRIGHLMEIAQEELIALIDYYCNPNLPLLSVDDAQVLVGIEMPCAVMAKGIDLHHSIRRPIFSHLFRMGTPGSSGDPNRTNAVDMDLPATLKAAPSQDEAATLVSEWASAKVGQVLGLPASDIEPSKPIHTYGIDSLVAVDLKNWFEREIGASLTVFDLMGNAPLRQLSALAALNS
ncbi:KR-domain-containing protein, partial [Aspergillus heteromorphus CBS 117.55]